MGGHMQSAGADEMNNMTILTEFFVIFSILLKKKSPEYLRYDMTFPLPFIQFITSYHFTLQTASQLLTLFFARHISE
jgi:hypothetical protein